MLRVTGEVGDGPPAECLADAARGDAVAMVVMGSRGADQQGDEAVGTVSERPMRICTKPVLVVPLSDIRNSMTKGFLRLQVDALRTQE